MSQNRFSIGDFVVYGSTGVCEIMDIRTPDISGARESYVLQPVYQPGTTVYAPIEGNRVKLRRMLSPEEVELLIDSMPRMDVYPELEDRQELYAACREALKSTDNSQLARMMKTLYEKKKRCAENNKSLSGAEKELFTAAESLVFGEVAASLNIPLENVQNYIDSRVDS